ncbi:MAG: aromatic amino acid lyase, partial [Candidatus Bipolaricaulia bacterium]
MGQRVVELDGRGLTLPLAERIVFGEEKVKPTEGALQRVERASQAVRRAIGRGERIYGVSTGFGKLSDRLIPPEQQRMLQENLLKSHAVAVGGALPREVSRAALLFRLNSLLKGYSGVRREIIHYLGELLNCKVYPS